jgi:hypothetical protein
MTGCIGTTFTAEDKNRDPRELAQRLYQGLRIHCCDLEELIESDSGAFSEKDLKRLDKAVTVMKVGFKIMKKVVRNADAHQKSVRLIASR